MRARIINTFSGHNLDTSSTGPLIVTNYNVIIIEIKIFLYSIFKPSIHFFYEFLTEKEFKNFEFLRILLKFQVYNVI